MHAMLFSMTARIAPCSQSNVSLLCISTGSHLLAQMSRPSNQVKIPSLLKNALGQDDMSMKGISTITQKTSAKSGEIDDEVNFDEFQYEDEDEDEEEIELDTAAVANGEMDDKNMNRLATHIEQLFRYAIDGEEEKLVELL